LVLFSLSGFILVHPLIQQSSRPMQSLSPTTFGLRFGSQLHLPCDLSASKLLPTISHIAIEALNPQEQALGTQALSGLHIIHLSGKSWQIIGEKNVIPPQPLIDFLEQPPVVPKFAVPNEDANYPTPRG